MNVVKLHLIGNWTFEHNCICTRGTSTLENGFVSIEGNLLFMSNKVKENLKCKSVAGMLLMHSNLYILLQEILILWPIEDTQLH